MKTFLLRKIALLIIAMTAALSADAKTFYYTYQGKTLKYYADDYNSTECKVYRDQNVSGYIEIPETAIDSNGKSYSVTSIGLEAFRGCKSLTSVTIPNSVTSIGEYAFYNCSRLTSVNIPNSVTSIGGHAFCNCSGLTSVSIPNSVTSIGEDTFGICSGLTSVTIPNSVTEIGTSAFSHCYSLTSVTIPNSVTSIGEWAFSYCSGLASVTIPNSVTAIGAHTFDSCTGLASVTIPNSVTSISRNAFYGCTQLSEITFPFSVDTIADGAFGGCEINQIICESSNPPTISSSAFSSYMYKYTKVIVPDEAYNLYKPKWTYFKHLVSSQPLKLIYELTAPGELINLVSIDKINNISSLKLVGLINGTDILTMNKMENLSAVDLSEATIVEGGMPYYKEDNKNFGSQNNTLGSFWSYNLTLLDSIVLPINLKAIDDNAFQGLVHLKSIQIPDSVSSIGYSAFNNCTNLTEVVIPNSVRTMGGNIFNGCKSLSSVIIGDSVDRIGDNSFSSCRSLMRVKIGASVSSIGDRAFSGCSKLTTLTVPKSVTNIGCWTFSGCSELKEIILEDGFSVLYWGYNSYSDSHGMHADFPLESLYLGRNLTGSDSWPTFRGITTLKSLYIGDLVSIFPNAAFSDCCLNLVNISSLESWCRIKFKKATENPLYYAKRLYINGDLLTDLTIPESVAEINDYTFCGLRSLNSLIIPNTVVGIGRETFDDGLRVNSLLIDDSEDPLLANMHLDAKDVYLGRNMSTYTTKPFGAQLETVTLSDFVTEINDGLFGGCSALASIIIPNSVTKIGSRSFENCSGLTTITIPNSVTKIGYSAFENCKGLSSVSIGNSVTEIGSSAFSGCSSLTEINIPGSVREIGSNAFANCGLAEITMINPIPAVIESDTFKGCADATLNVPDGSRNIYWIHPYWGQFKNIKVSGSESVEDFVADDVTYHVTSELLATVEVSAANLSANSRSAGRKLAIPESVTYNDKEYTVAGIANNGFENTGLTEITLPATINYVGLNAFKGCNGLVSITCSAVLPPSVDLSSFDEDVYNKATLNVLESSVEDYENNAVWRKFKMGALSGIESVRNDAHDAVQVVDGCIIAPEGCEVFDLYGHSINPENLSRGIYIVRMKNGETVKVKI